MNSPSILARGDVVQCWSPGQRLPRIAEASTGLAVDPPKLFWFGHRQQREGLLIKLRQKL